MTQPEYVPVNPGDRVRQLERLPAPVRWRPDRAAETVKGMPEGRILGVPGPDQGYALKLARRFTTRLFLTPGETTGDAIAGCVAVATKRAALFGRAPVIWDLEMAFTLWGYLGDAPEDLIDVRRRRFEGAAHHYELQRSIADSVNDEALRLSPTAVRDRLSTWRELIAV